MNRTIIDVHVIQTVPPSNLNRDDTGSPKTAMYGGVRRARVSSQAWKHATRKAFNDYLDISELGTRTKRVVEVLAKKIVSISPSVLSDEAYAMAEKVMSAAGIVVKEPRNKKGAPPESGYLLFLSAQQIESLAEIAVESLREGADPDKKRVQLLIKDKNSIDLALFGRMVADVSDLNVDASCQVAHALSTHAVTPEYDYFTAVDDQKAATAEEDAGAGMIGTVEFNSATLYRYATIDTNLLCKNLGDEEATARAVSAFLRAFVKSMPTGKQNTFANRTLPDAIVISVRDDQPVSFVGAFEDPVRETLDGGRVLSSMKQLVGYAKDVEEAYGMSPVATWVTGVGEAGDVIAALGARAGFEQAVDAVTQQVTQRLSESQS